MKNNLLHFMRMFLLQCYLFAMGTPGAGLSCRLASVACQTPAELGTELISATINGNVARVQTLIRNGVDVNFRRDHQRSALIYAAACGYIEIVDMLIRHRAHVNFRDCSGYTALMYAAANGYDETIDVLVRHGADVNVRDTLNRSALALYMNLVHVDRHISRRCIIETFLYAGASLRDLDEWSMAKLKSLLPEEKNQQLIERLSAEPEYVEFAKKVRYCPIVKFLQQRELGMKKRELCIKNSL